jgi:hypothetical protein
MGFVVLFAGFDRSHLRSRVDISGGSTAKLIQRATELVLLGVITAEQPGPFWLSLTAASVYAIAGRLQLELRDDADRARCGWGLGAIATGFAVAAGVGHYWIIASLLIIVACMNIGITMPPPSRPPSHLAQKTSKLFTPYGMEMGELPKNDFQF